MPDRQFPVGQRIELPGHFAEPVMLEAVRALGDGCECRVRLPNGTLEEIVLSVEETSRLATHFNLPWVRDHGSSRLLAQIVGKVEQFSLRNNCIEPMHVG
jgi:hypothetical protein